MTAFEVLVADRVSKKGLAPLRHDGRFEVVRVHDSSSPEFSEALAMAHGLIVRSATRVDRALLDQAPRLLVVGRAGVGVDNIDVPAATERQIPVFNSPGGNTIAAAELTLALMLSLVRRVTEADRSVRDKRWDRSLFKGVELRGRTLGLIGAGRVGAEVAARARAFGMDVLIFDPYLSPERAADLGAPLIDLGTLLDRSDVISLHVPLTEETRGLIGLLELERLGKRGFVVNVSRGGVIDESALVVALRSDVIAGAALDVFETEPLPDDSPLRKAPNLVLTPHLGASTKEAQIGVAFEVAVAIKNALLEGETSAAVNGDLLGT